MPSLPILLIQGGTLDDATKLGFTFAKEVATGLITVSTGLLTLSVTFAKDIFGSTTKKKVRYLKGAWAFHILSILFGVLTIMALTGDLMPTGGSRDLSFGPNVRLPAGAQIIAFFIGTCLLPAVYWGRSFQARTEFKYRRCAMSLGLVDTFEQYARDGWEVVSLFPVGTANEYFVLFKRSAPS